MALKQLKLAGFKSFVDPTVVPISGQLVGILGPNGCGKSNIIDAMRWVLGESSAKNLRGESMADVIFNGSSTRKPLGQASVELIFDNSLGRLAGPFASFAEVSVKRVVTREGDSTYYLNGTRCRRKDITDIFLGTGAGARSYSIIGQGTISKIIEARPEELRVFLEEAAGVSKYKERRRETLIRMEHTEENLVRVADIREELSKQLQRLERQAKDAVQYKRLKEDEKEKRADILVLKWRDLKQQQEKKQNQLQVLSQSIEKQQGLLSELNSERLALSDKTQQNSTKLEETQSLFYQLGTEIVRLEEHIQSQTKERQRLELDKNKKQEEFAQTENVLIQNKDNLELALLQLQVLEQQKEQQISQLQEKKSLSQLVQAQKEAWEDNNHKALQEANRIKRELELALLSLEHQEQKQRQTMLRIEQLQTEQASFSLEALEQQFNELEKNQEQFKASQSQDEQSHLEAKELVNQKRLYLQEIEQKLHLAQDEHFKLNKELAELKAWHKALKSKTKQDSPWSDKTRLMDILEVDAQWQKACETVLEGSLQAIVLESFDAFWPLHETCRALGESALTFKEVSLNQKNLARLSDHIKGNIPSTMPSLDKIYTATDFEEAKSWLPQLSEEESVVTANGLWLGKGWIKCAQVLEEDELGLLEGLQKINTLSLALEEKQLLTEELKAARDETLLQLQEGISHCDNCLTKLNASLDSSRENQTALIGVEQAILHAKARLETLLLELESQKALLEEIAELKLEQNQLVQTLGEQEKEQGQTQAQLASEKETWTQNWLLLSQELETLGQLAHQSELEYAREQTKIQQIKHKIMTDEERLFELRQALEQLNQAFLKSANPDNELHSQLSAQVARQKEVDLQLTLIREEASLFKNELMALEKSLLKAENEIKKEQEAFAQDRLLEQELAVRASTLEESLKESGFLMEERSQQLQEGISLTQRENEILALTEQLKKLGAINLAAIEEFEQEQQRKLYLDGQYQDLNEALATLETAIAQMDKETLARLQSTFDEVNGFFKSLFPRLFGGGRAQLELTCDNLLEAGIVVMAQPPGKRNSTIHLLSGGEKALTAVALVFAIFQLNPSPFCMLDEVDAPLDDVNVGRFCDLVKEMSQLVQFLFITHNKVTMELADHLIGVTMREPGVSRLVTVDVKQALTLE